MKAVSLHCVCFLAIGLFASAYAQQSNPLDASPELEPLPETDTPQKTPPKLPDLTKPPADTDFSPWEAQLGEARQQLKLIRLLTTMTLFGGATVRIPGELQRIPLEEAPEFKPLHDQGIRIYVEEVEFENLMLQYDEALYWREDHPVIPGSLTFKRIGIRIRIKTPFGVFPLGGKFHQGHLPIDMDIIDTGYTLHVSPPQRQAQARLKKADIEFGGPLASSVLSGLFGKPLAQTVLQMAVGQALTLNREDLMDALGISAFPGESSQGAGDSLLNLIDTFAK